MMTRTVIVAVVFGLAMLGWVSEARAATVTLEAVADTMLKSTSTRYSYGWDNKIEVQNKWQNKTVLIDFDLPGDLVGGTLNSATLRLDVYSTYFTAGTVDARVRSIMRRYIHPIHVTSGDEVGYGQVPRGLVVGVILEVGIIGAYGGYSGGVKVAKVGCNYCSECWGGRRTIRL